MIIFSLWNPWIAAYLHLNNLTFVYDFPVLILKDSTLLTLLTFFFAALSQILVISSEFWEDYAAYIGLQIAGLP